MSFQEIDETPELDANVRRYEPIAAVGRGGMAELLLALAHAGQGARRLVVLKRIWPELANDADFREMFLDEARLVLRLNHPNVVQTYDVLDAEGQLAIAMEYLEGQPLGRVWARLVRSGGELSLPLRLRIVIDLLAGLQYAHTLVDLDGRPLGLVHRDVSLDNVFVTYDGQVKVVDFGVAKTFAAAHQTRAGAIKGKLAYMAPEQFRGTALDWRADLFAAGIVLWEMLSGRRIWQGKTDGDIVAHLAAGRRMPWLPAEADWLPGLRDICAHALEPDPERRYQSAAQMQTDLEAMLIGSTESHPRNLGQVVSGAFQLERRKRQALIERGLRADEPTLELVDEPPMAEDHTIQLTPADLEILAPVVRLGARLGARGVRAAATIAALAAGVALLLGVAGWRRPATATTDTTPAVGPSIAANLQAPAPAVTPTVVSMAAGRAEKAIRPRPPRHTVIDEDAPLPPSLGVRLSRHPRRERLTQVFQIALDADAPLPPTTAP